MILGKSVKRVRKEEHTMISIHNTTHPNYQINHKVLRTSNILPPGTFSLAPWNTENLENEKISCFEHANIFRKLQYYRKYNVCLECAIHAWEPLNDWLRKPVPLGKVPRPLLSFFFPSVHKWCSIRHKR